MKTLITVLVTLTCASAHAGTLDYKAVLGKTPILFTVHAPDRNGTHRYVSPAMYGKMGSTLKVLDPSSKVLGPPSKVPGTPADVLGPSSKVLAPSSKVLGPSSRVLGPSSKCLVGPQM